MKFGEEELTFLSIFDGERKSRQNTIQNIQTQIDGLSDEAKSAGIEYELCILCGNSKPLRTMNIIALKLRIICKAKAIASENWGNRMYRGESQLPISFR